MISVGDVLEVTEQFKDHWESNCDMPFPYTVGETFRVNTRGYTEHPIPNCGVREIDDGYLINEDLLWEMCVVPVLFPISEDDNG